jgi:hypothetical protein
MMRRWVARQFGPDRRWQTYRLVLLGGWLVWIVWAFASAYDWPRPSAIDWDRKLQVADEMRQRALSVQDPAERQRLLDEAYGRGRILKPLQLQENVRRSEARLKYSRYATLILFAAHIPLVFVALRQRRRQQWLTSGRCGACGYDLRETPNLCPECGTPATPA